MFAWEASVWEGVRFWVRGVCNGNRDVYVACTPICGVCSHFFLGSGCVQIN